ncbi:MAG TPA: zf-HC2 domain-containing protein [Nitrospira sp.]|nr:zf-HC2 domain-containing protein [Nitrospira sp.]
MTEDQTGEAVPEITCREVAEWTSAYLDEHLQEAEKIGIALHLVTCGGCRTYVDQIVSVRKVVSSLPVPAVEQTQLDRLRQGLKARRKD